jgi:cytochrome c biogenesis protein CcmG/thiol:disulfide interchange protein DsbE
MQPTATNWRRAAAVVALLSAGAPAWATPSASDGQGPARIGQARPALELETRDGNLITDARVAGRPLVVDFFATWCVPCRNALLDLTFARQAAGSDALFVLIDLGESPEAVARWATEAPVPPQALVALDTQGVAARRWGANRLPSTFVIDAAGVVRHINRGWGPGYRERLTRWLRDVAGRGEPKALPPPPGK